MARSWALVLVVLACSLTPLAAGGETKKKKEKVEPPRRLGKNKRVVNNVKVASFGLSPVKSDPVKLGAYQSKPSAASAARTAASNGALQEKVDLRKYMTKVEDQSQSNSCAANAVAGAYEYLAKRAAMTNGDEVGDISRLSIYYVGRKRDQQRWGESVLNQPKDEGMTLGSAIEAVQQKGACLASTWPFNLDKVNAMPSEECLDEAYNYKVGLAKEIPLDLDAMRQALADGFPIIFGLKLTQAFFSPKNGQIETPDLSDPQSASHGLHAMLIVGYNDRKKVFIVRNSWGKSWGEDGYAYLPYDYGANIDFNFLGMYTIEGLTDIDFTPDEDDGEDHDTSAAAEDEDSEAPPSLELEEVFEEGEPDVPDEAFDVDDMFSSDAELRRVFDKFDVDRSGKLKKSELSAALTMMGVPLSNNKIRKAMAKYDKDQSGKIKFGEFKKMHKLFEGEWDPPCGFYCKAKRSVRNAVLPKKKLTSLEEAEAAFAADTVREAWYQALLEKEAAAQTGEL